MDTIATRFQQVRNRIAVAERRSGRQAGSVVLLAVSKTHSVDAIRAAVAAGQRRFAENRIQEALPKIAELTGLELEWHFIGAIQSNKTRDIATHFDWVHSVDRLKIAERLSAHRSPGARPLNVCLQVNISGENSKSGIAGTGQDSVAAAVALGHAIMKLPGLRLRGLMTVPAPVEGFESQRLSFRLLHGMFERCLAAGLPLDTLSMGMSGDMEAAIAEGATMVRIGTGIFGPRQPSLDQ